MHISGRTRNKKHVVSATMRKEFVVTQYCNPGISWKNWKRSRKPPNKANGNLTSPRRQDKFFAVDQTCWGTLLCS